MAVGAAATTEAYDLVRCSCNAVDCFSSAMDCSCNHVEAAGSELALSLSVRIDISGISEAINRGGYSLIVLEIMKSGLQRLPDQEPVLNIHF